MNDTVDILLPAEQQEGTESIVAAWLKKVGDNVVKNEPLVEINTDKVTVEVASPATGVLREIIKSADQKVEPGELLGRIELVEETEAQSEKVTENKAKKKPELISGKHAGGNLSLAVRRLLKEHQLEPEAVTGSGKDGRITQQDVLDHVNAQKSDGPSDVASKKIPHTMMRKRIAEHMTKSLLQTAPHVTTVFEADLSRVLAHRAENKAIFAKEGVKLTLTSYFVRATVAALGKVPEINSRWHSDYLEVYEDFNIGIATAVEGEDVKENGLLVPVIQKAQDLSLKATAKKLQDLSEKARQGSLTFSEVARGTFTISNHGVSGSLLATPIIINQPQSAILGIGKLQQRSVEVEGKIELRPMVYVTLTIDHRVIDGFKANLFLQTFVGNLESVA